MANALRSGGTENLCTVIDNHADLIDLSVFTASIPSNGTLRLTKNDGTVLDISIPYFSDFVVSGLNFTLGTNPNADDLSYTAGTYQLDGQLLSVASGGTVSLNAGDLTDPRVDLIYLDLSGNVNYLVGTPAANPTAPTPPADTLVVAEIGVAAGADNTGGYTLTVVNVDGGGGTSNVNDGTQSNTTLRWDNVLDVWVETLKQLVREDLTNTYITGAYKGSDIGLPSPIDNADLIGSYHNFDGVRSLLAGTFYDNDTGSGDEQASASLEAQITSADFARISAKLLNNNKSLELILRNSGVDSGFFVEPAEIRSVVSGGYETNHTTFNFEFANQIQIGDQNGLVTPANGMVKHDVAANRMEAHLNGSWQQLVSDLNSNVWVRSKEDLPAPVAGVITLQANTAYLIRGDIDLGADRISIPGNVNVLGVSNDVSSITSTTAGDLFTITGSAKIVGLDLIANSSTNLFDFTGGTSDTLFIDSVTSTSPAPIGSFTEGLQLMIMNSSFRDGTGGITLNGSWTSGVAIDNTLIIDYAAGADLIDFASGFDCNGRIKVTNCFFNAAGADIFNINDLSGIPAEGFVLLDNLFKTTANVLVGITANDVQSFFQDNQGLTNTSATAGLNFEGNTATTTITTAGTYESINNTATVTEELEKFSRTGLVFTYDGTTSIRVELTAILNFEGSNANVYAFKFAINGTQVGIPFKQEGAGTGDSQNVAMRHLATLDNGDTVEVLTTNTGATNDVDVQDMIFNVVQR